jgi:UDP-N-acetylmuramyl pentapeptide phosphotransferase/UDP-N-acetylglucosamine-1-phosphate transferase
MNDDFVPDIPVEAFRAGQLMKTAALVIVVILLFGLVGLGYLCLMYLFSSWNSGRNARGVHEIKAPGASRLGGLVGALIFMSCYLSLVFFAPNTPGMALFSNLGFWNYIGIDPLSTAQTMGPMDIFYQWSVVFICALLGLRKDFEPDYLSPKLRLAVSALLFGGLLYLVPNLIPRSLSVPVLDPLLQIDSLAWAMMLAWCLFFVQGFKRIDKANGLVPGIATFAMTVFFIIYGHPAEAALLLSCAMFLLFNITFGRLFYGDMGGFALGAIFVTYALEGLALGHFSAAFMLALFAYPCIDFLASIQRRIVNKRSLFAADNGCLHNLIYSWLKTFRGPTLLANSLTGLLISCGSSGLALIGFLLQWWPLTSGEWIWLFGLQLFLYWLVWIVLTRAGHVVD